MSGTIITATAGCGAPASAASRSGSRHATHRPARYSLSTSTTPHLPAPNRMRSQEPSVETMQTPPIAERDPVTRTHHGDTVIDEYEWLRNAQDPRTHAYLDDENTWTEQQTAHQAGLRDQI